MDSAPAPARVLLIDDDEDDYLMLRDFLLSVGGANYSIDWKSSYDAGKAELMRQTHDICFLDYRLGAKTGLDLLKEAVAGGCKTPIILLTGYGEREVDLEAMKVGAADYLVKDQVDTPVLERSIRYSIRNAENLKATTERENSFRSLLDSVYEGIFVHDPDGVILDLNKAGELIFGYSRKEMLGSLISDYCLDEDRENFQKVFRAGGEISLEVAGAKKDGTKLLLEISTKPYLFRGEARRLSALRDVTVKKNLEAQVLMQDRLASVGLLASSLAHEIGTPLGVIRGRAEYLGKRPRDEQDTKKNTDIIISQIDRVSGLIRSLLNLARGDQVKHTGEAVLSTIVGEVVDLMGHEFKKRSIEIQNRVLGDGTVRVAADAAPFHQVLLNLMINSMHAIETAVQQGRPTGHSIQLDSKDLGSFWAISVKDSGSGISKQNLRNLFKPFFTTKDIGVGTGLGLATSYRIVESWGGRIQVESIEGQGSTFTVVLPK